MSQVSLTIQGRDYQIACEDGQEPHLMRLGRYLDQRADQLRSQTGPVPDTLMMVMVALLVSDELSEVYAELEDLREQTGRGGTGSAREEAEKRLAGMIDDLAGRMEALAGKLGGA